MQIGNVDVDMNVDVESHPVGSFTPQNFQFQGKELLEVYQIVFFFVLPLIFEKIFAIFRSERQRKYKSI